jgi:uroporphyrinogen decarboxylase
VQPDCNNPGEIKQKYGRQLSFWGTISVQQTMPFGSIDDVKNEVKTRIRSVGYDGGLILAPAHVLGPEVPWQNIVAFFEAANTSLAQATG